MFSRLLIMMVNPSISIIVLMLSLSVSMLISNPTIQLEISRQCAVELMIILSNRVLLIGLKVLLYLFVVTNTLPIFIRTPSIFLRLVLILLNFVASSLLTRKPTLSASFSGFNYQGLLVIHGSMGYSRMKRLKSDVS